eukprot:TRINITY_DN96056_c0_g1_i1.p1 TRINITY_DN96056_c0_g1~~TRINITY_DN96056_c0_g1_i1.p1  ORF type:complete len:402 (+),score=66.06 TRINITY_DN96056_c0_g1_i1:40-1206(+)
MFARRQAALVVSVDSPTEGGPNLATRQLVQLIVGDYEEKGKTNGRPYFCKAQSMGEPVWLYFWDSRGRPGQSGWYFGKHVDSETVWAMSACDEPTPPAGSWKVPWDAPIAEDHLQVHIVPKGRTSLQTGQPWSANQHLSNGAFGLQATPSVSSHRLDDYRGVGGGGQNWVRDLSDLPPSLVPTASAGALSKTNLASASSLLASPTAPSKERIKPYQAMPRVIKEQQATAAAIVRRHMANLEMSNEGNFIVLAVELDTVFKEQAPNLGNLTNTVTLELEKVLKEVGDRVGLTYYWEPPTITQKRKQQDRQKETSARQEHMACLGVKKSIQRMRGAATRAEVESLYLELADQFITNLDSMGRQASNIQQEVENVLTEVNGRFGLTLDCPF